MAELVAAASNGVEVDIGESVLKTMKVKAKRRNWRVNKDTAVHMEAIDNTNEGKTYIEDSRVVELMGRLRMDLFLQDRFLINGVTIKIRL